MKTFLLINLWPKTPVCFYYTYILFISFVYNLAKKLNIALCIIPMFYSEIVYITV